jgi:hypothetical protein
MASEAIRPLYNAAPFRPFTIHLADGHHVSVVSREFIAAAPVAPLWCCNRMI